MPDILCDFPIQASLARVFAAISTPEGLDAWWTRDSTGRAELGASFELGFGPGYRWHARVTRCVPDTEFTLILEQSDADWNGSRVAFDLRPEGQGTQVRFAHTGWPVANEHYRISCYCWPMYLRILRRYLEHGESVPYEQRLDV